MVFQFNPDSSSTQKLEQPSKCSDLEGISSGTGVNPSVLEAG